MQNTTGRTRRQTRQSAAAQAASTPEQSGSKNAGLPSPHGRRNVPGAGISYPPGATSNRTPPTTRVTRRSAARGGVAPEQDVAVNRQQAEKGRIATFHKAVQILLQTNQLMRDEAERLINGSVNIEAGKLMTYLEDNVGKERLKRAALAQVGNTQANQQLQNQQRAQTAVMQQTALTNAGGVARPAAYSMQRLMGQFGMPPAQMGGSVLAQPTVRPLSYGQGLPQQLNQRPGQQAFPQDALGYPISQRTIPGSPNLSAVCARMSGSQTRVSGEVAKTLMPPRTDGQMLSYTPGGYFAVSGPQMPRPVGMPLEYSRPQLTNESRIAADAVSIKRTAMAPIENPVTKAARNKRAKRPVEDPSAPDVGDMDVVTEADIQLAEEQEALLTDVPSQGVSNAEGQLIESKILNVQAVQLRFQQLLRERGMNLSGPDAVDVLMQGMEEKFEDFLMKATKRAIHRIETGHVNDDSETKKVTSDVRTKLREIKKKQEQNKADKLKEEREKLEQLAETASKKELASNKELAAKVEKVKREKQFNAEAEAANRALSNALGGFGFEKYRKMKKDKEAKEAAERSKALARPAALPTTTPPPLSSIPTGLPPLPNQPPSQPKPSPSPALKPSTPEEKRPIVLHVKDLISVMEQDRHYSFSPTLYGLHLSSTM